MSLVCGARCPGSMRTCERSGHHWEHQATLEQDKTYVYWYGSDFPVRERVGTVRDRASGVPSPVTEEP